MSIVASIISAGILTFAGAGGLVATDVIRAGETLRLENVEAKDGTLNESEQNLLGREVIRTVYPGRDVLASNTRQRRLVIRNQDVQIKYRKNGLEISLNGRAMSDGGIGEQVSVMNTSSRKIVSGIVTQEGWVQAQ